MHFRIFHFPIMQKFIFWFFHFPIIQKSYFDFFIFQYLKNSFFVFFIRKWKNPKIIFWIIVKWKNKKMNFLNIGKIKNKRSIIEFLIFRCFHLGGLLTNDNIPRKCRVFIGIWKNIFFWIFGKWKNEKLKFWIIGKRTNQKMNYLIFRCFHLGGSSTNDKILRKCWVFIRIWKNPKNEFLNYW